MIKNITVIGAGSTGHAAAALYAMKGFSVTLFEQVQYADHLEDIQAGNGILLRGKVRGMSPPIKITTSIPDAICGAELIAVHVMAERHEDIARLIAPYIEDGQHILIVPGNLGSFVFRRVFGKLGINPDITISEQSGNLCPCRLTGEAEVTIGLPLKPKSIASLPASDTLKVIRALDGVWEFSALKDVFEGAINENNVVMHIAPTVLSATRIERIGEKFVLFQEGFTPTSVECGKKIREERLAIMEAMGVQEHGNPMQMFYDIIRDPSENPHLDIFRTLSGPDSISHRYLQEDAKCGGAFALSVAQHLSIETPVLHAFVTLAGILNNEDYIKHGRTLENLGFPSHMSMQEIYASIR